jgi:diguanylate cyclase (GGDEF)-like protein
MDGYKRVKLKRVLEVMTLSDSRRLMIRQFNILTRFSQSLNEANNFDSALRKILKIFIKVTGASSGALLTKDETSGEFKPTINSGVNPEFKQILTKMLDRINGDKAAIDSESSGRTKNILNRVLLTNPKKLNLPSDNCNYIITIPLRSTNKAMAVVVLKSDNEKQMSEEEKQLLKTMGWQGGIAIENALLLQKVSQLSLIDELTQLYNRRYFDKVLDIETARASRYQRPLSLIILDIDMFKEFNDKFGHGGGDKILKSLADAMNSNLRDTDTCFRLGGDEFAVIMPETDSRKAKETIERIRIKWSGIPKIDSLGLENPIGFSAGIVEYPRDTESPETLLVLADIAMYCSKKNGGYQSTLVSEMKESRLPTVINVLSGVN